MPLPLPFHPRKGMSLRAAGKEFPAATTSMIFGYFHMEKKRNRNKRAVQLSFYWFRTLYMLVTPLLEKKYQYNNKSSGTNDNSIYCTKGCAVTAPSGPCHLTIAPRGLENPWIHLRVYGFRLPGFLQFFLKNHLGTLNKRCLPTLWI